MTVEAEMEQRALEIHSLRGLGHPRGNAKLLERKKAKGKHGGWLNCLKTDGCLECLLHRRYRALQNVKLFKATSIPQQPSRSSSALPSCPSPDALALSE